jgi:MFS-type transporter involved in bile tolerance (Atg22 family)
MSNIFLATALIYLASESVGCVVMDKKTGDMKVDDECEEEVYGLFRPAAMMTNIGAASGFLSALLMPLAGAIIDFTDYRRTVGIGASIFIVASQATQMFTNSSNWFAMAILQALWGCSYNMLSKTRIMLSVS